MGSRIYLFELDASLLRLSAVRVFLYVDTLHALLYPYVYHYLSTSLRFLSAWNPSTQGVFLCLGCDGAYTRVLL